jgi:hypothetical protein
MASRATALIGRDRELELLTKFREQVAAEGGAFLLVGEPGAGKTALLDAAAAAAAEAGTAVLRAAGVEFEADLTYSGLHQLLLPVFGQFERLSAAHRDALNVALGYEEGPPPDRLLVSTATLTALLQAAADRPVLMVVDDLPWLDRASAGVLGFVARRPAGSRVGFLAALRRGEESFFAYRSATAISPAGVLASHIQPALWVPMDLVEAAVRTGRHAEAAAHVTAVRDAHIAILSPRLALLATASEAIIAPDDLAPRLFDKALAIPGADRFPFDLARVQLCYGERLRRAQAITGSRTQLTAALEIFERLGARP